MTPYRIGESQLAWWMPQIEERGQAIALSGVIRPAAWPPSESYRLAVDGEVSTTVDYLDQPAAGAVNFRAMLPVGANFRGKSEIVLRVMSKESQKFVREWDHFHLARPSGRSLIALPPPKLTQRAIWMGPIAFDKEGYSLARKYLDAVRGFLPRRQGRLKLLDWGCGAGRLARYLVDDFDYTGIDIDNEAIEWCRQSIPRARFELQDMSAHTVFSDNSFDAVIGISIFTHLREEDQFAWLSELARVARPDGVVAVSVNGATSLLNAGNPPQTMDTLKVHGFCDTGVEPSHKGVTLDDTYYRNTYHTQDYIREKWIRDFEILGFIPAFVGNMQDILFLRPLV